MSTNNKKKHLYINFIEVQFFVNKWCNMMYSVTIKGKQKATKVHKVDLKSYKTDKEVITMKTYKNSMNSKP